MLQDGERAEVTEILSELGSSVPQPVIARLLPLVYDELRALSAHYLRQERKDHTLQATALVHEAYMRLAGADGTKWKDRAHFFRVAAKTMRRVLINYAHMHKAAKRGGGCIVLRETLAIQPDSQIGVTDLDEAIVRLAEIDQHKAQVVELRFFGGCSIEETAEVMNISTATVERHWRFARAWLRSELVG